MKNAVLVVVAYAFFVCLTYAPQWLGWNKGPRPVERVITDTVYVPVPYQDTVYVPVEKQTLPNKITIYKEDTVRRKRLEKDTLVTGIRIAPGKMEVEKLAPLGTTLVSEFKGIPEYATIAMDASGHVSITADPDAVKKAKCKRFLKKAWNTAKTVGIVAAAIIIVKKVDN